MLSEKEKLQGRGRNRKYRHGNWRQIVVDCGGMCVAKDKDGLPCCNVNGLEFHEPFKENKHGWLMFQQRILLCNHHHWKEHTDHFPKEENRYIHISQLNEDVSIEILLHGGYDNWIKHYNLNDTFGRLLI